MVGPPAVGENLSGRVVAAGVVECRGPVEVSKRAGPEREGPR